MNDRRISILLLVTVVVVHYGYEPACALVQSLHDQQRGVFYVLRGFEGAILFGVLAWLRPSLWPVLLWGGTEEAETAVCRLSAGFPASPIGSPWNGLCSDLTHLPLYYLGVVAAAILATRALKGDST